MILKSVVTVQPKTEPLTVAEAKDHLKISGSEEDTAIARLILRARRMVENYTNLSLLTQTREIKLNYFPCSIELPYGPVQSVEIDYTASDGTSASLTQGTDFILVNNVISSDSWPTADDEDGSVVITYVAGYTNVGEDHLPEEAIEMCQKLVARLYEKRGDEDSGGLFTDEIMDLGDSVKVYGNANV